MSSVSSTKPAVQNTICDLTTCVAGPTAYIATSVTTAWPMMSDAEPRSPANVRNVHSRSDWTEWWCERMIG